MFKLFVETSGKRARLVPAHSKLGVAERNFGEIDRVAALSNIDSLEDAIREMLEDKGIEDAELYVITVPDELAPRPKDTTEDADKETKLTDDGKGSEVKKKTETPKHTPPTETAEVKDKTAQERQVTGQEGEKKDV